MPYNIHTLFFKSLIGTRILNFKSKHVPNLIFRVHAFKIETLHRYISHFHVFRESTMQHDNIVFMDSRKELLYIGHSKAYRYGGHAPKYKHIFNCLATLQPIDIDIKAYCL